MDMLNSLSGMGDGDGVGSYQLLYLVCVTDDCQQAADATWSWLYILTSFRPLAT